MKRLAATLAVLILNYVVHGQKSTFPAAGEVIEESLHFSDLSGKPVKIEVPADSLVFLYRYRGQSWLPDNADSLKLLEKILQDFSSPSPASRRLRVICYAYNVDNYLLAGQSYRGLTSEGPYRTENYLLNEKNAARVLQGQKICIIDTRGKILYACGSIAAFKYSLQTEKSVLKGKLLTEQNGTRIPLRNVLVLLKGSAAGDTTARAYTDKYGDFEVKYPADRGQRSLRVELNDNTVDNVLLASQEGVIRGRMFRSGDGFEYKLIEADLQQLDPMKEDEDIALAIRRFTAGRDRELLRSESINFKSGSYKLEQDSKLILDKIARQMSDHPALNLEVISHTDALGDDQYNLELSEKRSLAVVAYLIYIGVHKNRLTYAGKGETQLRNRCGNGVECSDKEHHYNRRTEFRFFRETIPGR